MGRERGGERETEEKEREREEREREMRERERCVPEQFYVHFCDYLECVCCVWPSLLNLKIFLPLHLLANKNRLGLVSEEKQLSVIFNLT